MIGKNEYAMVSEIDGVEFIIFDKSLGAGAYKAVQQQLKNWRFDVLLHMQMALRESITSMIIKTNIRLGIELVVNHYPEALQQCYQATVKEAPWGKHIQNDECMRLITSEDFTAMTTKALQIN